MIFRKITENISFKDNPKINSMIEEALLNSTFSSLVKIDQKNSKVIMKEITSTIDTYLFFEYCDSVLVDSALKKGGEDFIIDFYSYKKKLSQTVASYQQ